MAAWSNTPAIGGRGHHPGPGRAIRARHGSRPCHAFPLAHDASLEPQDLPFLKRDQRRFRVDFTEPSRLVAHVAHGSHRGRHINEVEAQHRRPGRGFSRLSCRGNSPSETRPAKPRKARCRGSCGRGSNGPIRSAPASAPTARSAAPTWSSPRMGTSFTSKATRAARSTKASYVRRGSDLRFADESRTGRFRCSIARRTPRGGKKDRSAGRWTGSITSSSGRATRALCVICPTARRSITLWESPPPAAPRSTMGKIASSRNCSARPRHGLDREPGAGLTQLLRPKFGRELRKGSGNAPAMEPGQCGLHPRDGVRHGRESLDRLPVCIAGKGARSDPHTCRPAVHPHLGNVRHLCAAAPGL